MNKYILLKDLPDFKAGEVFIKGEDSNIYEDVNKTSYYSSETVETNTEWFKKAEELIYSEQNMLDFGKFVREQYRDRGNPFSIVHNINECLKVFKSHKNTP